MELTIDKVITFAEKDFTKQSISIVSNSVSKITLVFCRSFSKVIKLL